MYHSEKEKIYHCKCHILYRTTSHLSVRLTAMLVTVNEVSSHLCKMLTLVIVKIYLQTGRRRYRIAGRPVVACEGYFSLNDF